MIFGRLSKGPHFWLILTARLMEGGANRNGSDMDFEKYTERSRGFIQAAQNLALREGHQRLTPEHILKVLLDDKEGLAAGLIRAAGGDHARALAQVEATLAKMPKVEGSGAGQVYLAPETARLFEQAEKIAEKAGDSYVTAERLLLALAMADGTGAALALKAANVNPQALEIDMIGQQVAERVHVQRVELVGRQDAGEQVEADMPGVAFHVPATGHLIHQAGLQRAEGGLGADPPP